VGFRRGTVELIGGKMFYFLFVIGAIYALFTFWFAVTSYQEKALRAAFLGTLFFGLMAGLLAFYAWLHETGRLEGSLLWNLQVFATLGLALFTLFLFLPTGRNKRALAGTKGMSAGPAENFNQKDTVFNIAHVGGFGPKVGRQRWALQSRDPFGGIFWTLVMGLRGQVDGKISSEKTTLSARENTKRIKETARGLGADLVGITTLKEDLTYSQSFSYEESKLETGPPVTVPVELRHKYVIVLGKEMDYQKIQATLTPENEASVGEVGKTYYGVAQIACALSSYIRQLGFPARAHHLRNEQIFQVPHAVDAGLGEQGRFNYLITPRFGPRVRLSSVTTALDLDEDHPVDLGVQDFCSYCKLCEINCPPQAITGEKGSVRGYTKWIQDPQKCFLFWVSAANTFACSQCLKVCPWNKPDHFVHRVGFWAARRSFLSRRVLYWLHVLFYGRKYSWQRLPHQEEAELPPETSGWKR